MKNIKIIAGISILLSILGCEKMTDPIFQESSSFRLNESIANIKSTLQSNSSGWIIEYYPSKLLEFGGYTLFATFDNKGNVIIEGDYTTMKPQTSFYDVYAGSGPILTFNSYNPIVHYFSLPGTFNDTNRMPDFVRGQIGSNTDGMKGDLEFTVHVVTKDSILLKGRKTYNNIKLYPIKPDEKSTILKSYRDATAKFNVFRGFNFEIGEENITTTFVTSSTKRSLNIPKESDPLAYRYIPNGLDFYKEYEVKGIKFKTLHYVSPTTKYNRGYFTNDKETIKLVPTS